MSQVHPLRQKESQLFGETLLGRDVFFPIESAQNAKLTDVNGKEYIDFTSGWNVTNIGWNNHEVRDAIVAQLDSYAYAPMWTPTKPGIELAEKLQTILPASLNTFFKCTSGTEANEWAIKIARAFTQKKKILSFYGEYHGQTMGSLSLGNSAATTEAFEPLVPGFLRTFYPYSKGNPYSSDPIKAGELALKVIEDTIKLDGDIAAVLLEPLLSCPGMFTPPAGFIEGLRKITKEHRALLIFDEVGTGFGRTGKMFGFEHFSDVVPDILTMAKGMSGGFAPIGAAVTSREIADSMKGKGGTSTFGWHPLATTASTKVIEILVREKLADRAEKLGTHVIKVLQKELQGVEIVGEIRGWGLELGVEIIKDQQSQEQSKEKTQAIMLKCLEKGLHILWSGRTTTLMIMPPLTIPEDDLNRGLEILIETIKEL